MFDVMRPGANLIWLVEAGFKPEMIEVQPKQERELTFPTRNSYQIPLSIFVNQFLKTSGLVFKYLS